MEKKERKIERINSLGWFLLSIVLVVVGFLIIIPTLNGYGILWTFVAIVFAGYHGYNVFSKKKFSMWDTDISLEDREDA